VEAGKLEANNDAVLGGAVVYEAIEVVAYSVAAICTAIVIIFVLKIP
jgi:hypothetical protein